jgi:hypothetical protein
MRQPVITYNFVWTISQFGVSGLYNAAFHVFSLHYLLRISLLNVCLWSNKLLNLALFTERQSTKWMRPNSCWKMNCTLQTQRSQMHTPRIETSQKEMYCDMEQREREFRNIELTYTKKLIQVRGFKPGRSLQIFRAKKSSARLPSEGK